MRHKLRTKIAAALLCAALAALPLLAAQASRFSLAPLSGVGATAAINLGPSGSVYWLQDNVSGTVDVIVTGSPTTCKYVVEGKLDDANSHWAVLGYTDDCTGAADCYPSGEECNVFHWTDKSVDQIRGRVVALSGGSAPTVAARIKLVTK